MASSSRISDGTPKAPPPSLKKSASSSKSQTSIAGFFAKSTPATTKGISDSNALMLSKNGLAAKKHYRSSSQSLTPVPSSDAAEPGKEEESAPAPRNGHTGSSSLPSPVTPASVSEVSDQTHSTEVPKGFYSPSRKVNRELVL